MRGRSTGRACREVRPSGIEANRDLAGRQIDDRGRDEERRDAARPALFEFLVLALDGIGRDLLYELLRDGKLPELAKLLFASKSGYPHAHFNQRLLSALPSSTLPGWVTGFTGVTPAEHGVTGNEFFIREEMRFAAPIPATFSDDGAVLACYTDGYANQLVGATAPLPSHAATPLVKQPFTDQANIGFSRSLGKDYAIEVDAVYAHAQDLGTRVAANVRINGGPRRLSTYLPQSGGANFRIDIMEGESYYKGVNIALKKRASGNLSFTAWYSLSSSESNASLRATR